MAGEVAGIPVASVDAGWRYATTLSAEAFRGRVTEADIRELADSNLSLFLQSDLNDDGVAEQFSVGTYEATSGEVGRFILIMQGRAVLAHFTESGRAGFSALLSDSNGVRWYKCMVCGEYELIRWSSGAFVLE